jgi:hypothetical protein
VVQVDFYVYGFDWIEGGETVFRRNWPEGVFTVATDMGAANIGATDMGDVCHDDCLKCWADGNLKRRFSKPVSMVSRRNFLIAYTRFTVYREPAK